jgi:hypothetical protein
MIGFHCPAFIVAIAATRMYRGLSDYLVRTDIFHSTHVAAGGQSNGTPFGKFVAPPNPDTGTNVSGSGGTQSSGQVFVTKFVTGFSSDTTEKAASGSDEPV